MPGLLLHQGALPTCMHQTGVIAAVPPVPPRVFVNFTMPVLNVPPSPTGRPAVAGCLFTLPGPKPSPCLQVVLTPATRVFVNGQPAAILTPAVLCVNETQAPQGPPNSLPTQTRVIAT
jgi:hypothetical protein